MQAPVLQDVDRLSIRNRPQDWWIMRQNWGKLLFIHWSIPAHILRPLIPNKLTIDTYNGEAWIGVVPFTMWGIRAAFVPPVPGIHACHELNIRTYVHYEGVPGVWFLSLDANSNLAVWGARTFFFLPYFNAEMRLEQVGAKIHYLSHRTHKNTTPAEFVANWSIGDRLPETQPGSLEFFLTERYCLYSFNKNNLYRCRIHHRPWPLRQATLNSYYSTMLESHGLPAPTSTPLLHYAESLKVDVYSLKRCG
jgi:uncharacterized protein